MCLSSRQTQFGTHRAAVLPVQSRGREVVRRGGGADGAGAARGGRGS